MNAISVAGTPPVSRAGVHLHAIVTACSTLLLIFVGGLVTSHDAGLAVPDWPTTYDENMFLYPPARWVGGILYEHGHRLTATAIGLLTLLLALRFGLSEAWKLTVRRWIRGATVALAVLSLFRLSGQRLWMSLATTLVVLLGTEFLLRGAPEPRRWVRRLGYFALGAVLLQGLLGGLTVHYLLPLPISVAHACLAQAFLCLLVTLAVVTSASWIAAESGTTERSGSGVAPGAGLWRFAAVTAGVVYLQLVIGACMRHMNAGLAIPDFPLAFGRIIPPLESLPVAVHFAHRIGALLVSASILTTAMKFLFAGPPVRRLAPLGLLLVLLTGIQVTLGAYTVWTRTAPWPTTFHVATGAAVLATSVWLALRSYEREALGEARA